MQDHIRIASVDVANTDTGYAAAVSTPLEMNLKSGIEIQLDGAKFAQVAFSSCINTGCVAELSLTETMFAALQKGRTLSVSFSDLQWSGLKSDMSLTGFPAAMSKLAP